MVSYLQDIFDEIKEGKTKKLCCVVDSSPSPISTRWINGSQQILVTHFVAETCYTINNVSRFDQGNYTCIAENIVGSGSITTVLKVKCKFMIIFGKNAEVLTFKTLINIRNLLNFRKSFTLNKLWNTFPNKSVLPL